MKDQFEQIKQKLNEIDGKSFVIPLEDGEIVKGRDIFDRADFRVFYNEDFWTGGDDVFMNRVYLNEDGELLFDLDLVRYSGGGDCWDEGQYTQIDTRTFEWRCKELGEDVLKKVIRVMDIFKA